MGIDTSPETDAMAQARAALLALNKRADNTGALAAEAFFELSSVHPPYPPAQVLPEDAQVSVEGIHDLLRAAARATSDVEEIDRIVHASSALSTGYIQ